MTGGSTARPIAWETCPTTRPKRPAPHWNRLGPSLQRLRIGIDLLASDQIAAEAFAFANHTMWQQRLHTLVGFARRDDPKLTLSDAETLVASTPNWSWRPFQIAFVLVNLPSLADPTHAERQLDTGTADLLFFPTGGGKTEAYLGLTAFTLAIRRLQGEVSGHSGEGGVGVLMRYTLRLLTSQQFQRAATLICACEVRRRELIASGDARWGETPFRIGMWVGGIGERQPDRGCCSRP